MICQQTHERRDTVSRRTDRGAAARARGGDAEATDAKTIIAATYERALPDGGDDTHTQEHTTEATLVVVALTHYTQSAATTTEEVTQSTKHTP